VRCKSKVTNPLLSLDSQRYFDLYVNVTFVSSSRTSGLTKLDEFPARGTSTRTGNTPEMRCCRFVTLDKAASCCFSAFFRASR